MLPFVFCAIRSSFACEITALGTEFRATLSEVTALIERLRAKRNARAQEKP